MKVTQIKKGKYMQYSTYESIKMDDNLPVKVIHIDTESEEMKSLGYDSNSYSFIPRHWHRSLEFTYIIKGSMKLTALDEKRIVKKDDVLVINSGVIHEVGSSEPGPSEVICLLISYEFLKENIPNFDSISFKIDTEKLDSKFFKKYFEKILTLSKESTISSNLEIRSLLLLLLSELSKNHISDDKKDYTRDNEFMIEVLEWMHDHYTEQISLNDAAEEFSMSREHFSRIFKQSIGESFLKYLYQYRLHRAHKDIFKSDKSLEFIASSHGFPNVKSLISRFKEQYGDTPGNLRKKNGISIIDHKSATL